MAEYAGYVAPKTVDYGAMSSSLLDSRLAAEKLRQDEESDALKLLQKQQEAEEKARIQKLKEVNAEDKLLREDLKSIQSPEPIVNKTFTDFVMKMAESSRAKIVELNNKKRKGEITSTEYLMGVNNLTNGVKQYVDISKVYGKNLEELTTSISKNEQSPIGVFKIGKYANAGQYNNKLVEPADDDSGVLEYYTIDADGNKVKDQTIPNIDLLKSKDLYSDRVVDYNALFKAADESIGTYKKEVGATTVSSKLQKDNIDALVAKKANEIIPLDDDKARLLASKLGYGIYSDEQEKQIALQQMYPIAEDREKAIEDGSAEKKLIKYKINDKGAWSPDLTPDQKATAVEYATSDIKGRFEYSELKDEPVRVSVNAGKKPTESKIVRNATFKTATKAFEDILANGSKSPALQDIKNLYKGYYENGVDVEAIKNTKTGKMMGARVFTLDEDGKRDKEIDRITSVKDMFRLFTPKDRKGQEYVDYNLAIEEEGDFNDL